MSVGIQGTPKFPRPFPRKNVSIAPSITFLGNHMARFRNILETIGNTPLVRLNKLAPAGVNLYVKVESFNPMGSVKDRMARAIIERAEESGALKPGQTVIEATSGNTGIGLAMVCAQKGYPLVVTMAESFSIERRKLLRFLGARVVLTPAAEKGSGMLAKAVELARETRLVPVPPVRERSQRRCALAHHGAGNPRGLRRRAHRLLGDGLWHRRHAQGRRARVEEATPGDAHHCGRARQLPGARQRHPHSSAGRTAHPPPVIHTSGRT